MRLINSEEHVSMVKAGGVGHTHVCCLIISLTLDTDSCSGKECLEVNMCSGKDGVTNIKVA
jgi:hypothetical protein